MKFRQSFLLPLILILMCAATVSQAQLWSGLIDPSRAIDWSNSGIPGGIPSSNWTQCGATVPPCASSGCSSIQTAINACGINQYVQLGAGTFTPNTVITLKSQMELRGMGADKTFLVPYGNGPGYNNANYSCNGLDAVFCIAGSNSYLNGGVQNWASWTGGFAPGTTSITLSNSLNIVAGRTELNLEQRDELTDTGNIWNCDGNDGGCGGANGGGASGFENCSGSDNCAQQQAVLVTACSPSCNNAGPTVVTISPGLYMPNWRIGQVPSAFWANTTGYEMGIQNLSVDMTQLTGSGVSAMIDNCYECWVRGIRSVAAGRSHIWIYDSSRSIVRDNYFYQNANHATQSYGIELFAASSDNLIENNICQQVTDSCPNNNGGGSGSVAAYNFEVKSIFAAAGWFQGSDYEHAGGYSFWLREGNIGLGLTADNVHGTHHFTTAFRNYYSGYQPDCFGVPCGAQIVPIHLYAASRYFNIIGNVLGYPGEHGTYSCGSPSGGCTAPSPVIYKLGFTGNDGVFNPAIAGFCTTPNCSTHGGYDPLTISSLMRWGNYDVVNNSVQFNSSEVPSGFADTTGNPSVYANHLPSSHSIPASLHYTAKPGWWPSTVAWPPIGPDVTGGNVSAGSGPSASLGGHVFMNPAMNCFINVMGGRPDGTGSLLSFNADSCYGSSTANLPASPTGLAAVVQ